MTCNIDKTTKTCTKCNMTKPIEEFNRDKRSLDGRQSRCKMCESAKVKAWRAANKERKSVTDKAWYEANKERVSATSKAWYEENRERHLARMKAWREANRERYLAAKKAYYEANKESCLTTAKAYRDANKERRSATVKAWYEANKERRSAINKAWRDANPGRVSATIKAWREANPEVQAAYTQRRRATKLRQTPLTWFTQKEIDKQFAYVKRYCRKFAKALGIQWDVDHVVPLNGMIGGTAGTKVVSGLHWGGNFAALPSKYNSSHQCYEWPDKWEYDNTYYDEETGTLLEREPNQVGDLT